MNTQDINNPETEKKSGGRSTPASSPAINDKTVVKVKSLVNNVFYTCDKTYDSFAWYEAGEVQEMTFMQLKIMNMKHPRYFTEKWLKPLNSAVIDKLKLNDVFTSKLNKYEKKKFYGDDAAAVEQLLSGLNESALNELRGTVISDVKDGKIGNAKIIRLLEKYLDEDLMQYV